MQPLVVTRNEYWLQFKSWEERGTEEKEERQTQNYMLELEPVLSESYGYLHCSNFIPKISHFEQYCSSTYREIVLFSNPSIHPKKKDVVQELSQHGLEL